MSTYFARREQIEAGGQKQCRACLETKPLAEFHHRRDAKRPHLGVYAIGTCKACERVRMARIMAKRRAQGRTQYEREFLAYGWKVARDRAWARHVSAERTLAIAERLRCESMRRAEWKRVRHERRQQWDAMIARLLAEDPTSSGLPSDALEYRARYRYDDEFRAKELRRRYAQKMAEDLKDDGSLTGEELRRMFAMAKRCPMCGRPMRSSEKVLDHIHPKSRGGLHSALNARVVCRRCNSRKAARLPDQLSLGVAYV